MQKSKWATPASVEVEVNSQAASEYVPRLPADSIPSQHPVEPVASEIQPEKSTIAQPVAEPLGPGAAPSPELAQTIPTFDGGMDDLDEFAQTRQPDDLFSDDFEPIEDPVIEERTIPTQKIPSGPRHKKGPRQNGTGRQAPTAPTTGETNAVSTEEPRKQSVRGDRSGTGGIKKTKLTEEELSQRMEAVKLKNQSLEAAHARAEADEASFQAREAEDIQKRRLERQNRQQMMGEREKNRQRKINQLGGREWDADKNDEPETGRGSQYRRGAHGGVVPESRQQAHEAEQDLSQYIYEDNPRGGNRGRGRGRGGRGGDRGRGRGRGILPAGEIIPQGIPTAMDFPSLPIRNPPAQSGALQKVETAIKKPTPKSAGATLEQPVNKPSWADEMDTPIESGVAT